MRCCGPQLSVIVPLAPGEPAWTGLLEQLRAIPSGSEVILVRAAAEPLDLPLDWPPSLRLDQCQGEHGRAGQMNAGARAACGRWLWFLHADSRLTETTLPALRAFLARGRDGLGFFHLGFLRDGPRLTALNALGANLRSRWLSLPFGDQGFVLPAHWFWRLGGYDEQRPFGEDHQLVWQAREAALPMVPLSATVLTSARKYRREGWLPTTLRHVWLTLRQAAPAWYGLHRGARLKPALAIFVKTPGHSPVKTRLARDFGEARAVAFHLHAAAAVQAVADVSRMLLEPYWAVAEQQALPCWSSFPVLWQGDGGLGQRLHTVYSTLQATHGRVLLVGADTPQITQEDLQHALDALEAAPFVLGPSADGGFWLFGGRQALPAAVWTEVRYSVASTAAELDVRLAPHGPVRRISTLADVDSTADLVPLRQALARLPAPLAKQQELLAWLRADAATDDAPSTTMPKEIHP